MFASFPVHLSIMFKWTNQIGQCAAAAMRWSAVLSCGIFNRPHSKSRVKPLKRKNFTKLKTFNSDFLSLRPGLIKLLLLQRLCDKSCFQVSWKTFQFGLPKRSCQLLPHDFSLHLQRRYCIVHTSAPPPRCLHAAMVFRAHQCIRVAHMQEHVFNTRVPPHNP